MHDRAHQFVASELSPRICDHDCCPMARKSSRLSRQGFKWARQNTKRKLNLPMLLQDMSMAPSSQGGGRAESVGKSWKGGRTFECAGIGPRILLADSVTPTWQPWRHRDVLPSWGIQSNTTRRRNERVMKGMFVPNDSTAPMGGFHVIHFQ